MTVEKPQTPLDRARRLSARDALLLLSACREEIESGIPRALRGLLDVRGGKLRANQQGLLVGAALATDARQCRRLEAAIEVQSRDGCEKITRARATGTLVGLYRSVEAGIETDPDSPWSTVCEEHHAVVCHETRRGAELAMARPDDWCDDCRDAAAAQESV